ncbi:MAG: ribonuclease T2 [Rhizobiales bacterium]|nr:ribonuclease T2 [Hyphomicrobiales bacterium]
MLARPICLMLGLAVLVSPSLGQIRLDGTFAATRNCPAYQSISKQTNPGNVTIAAGNTYVLIGKNKDVATHYLIQIEGAVPAQRWVSVDCGTQASAAGDQPAVDQEEPQSTQTGHRFVLALSWQAAFCETRPTKPECESQTDDRFDATNFSLHGLWPQPRRRAYCGVDAQTVSLDEAGHWSSLPEPAISDATRARLAVAMPGTQSQLHRHEWIKHGTCYPEPDADEYFSDALLVLAAINASPVQQLIASREGRKVSTAEIRQAFDRAFGEGAGLRVRVACVDDGDRRLISEVTIGLVGTIEPGADIGALILGSGPTDSGCPGGIVDPVGLQ